MITKLTLKLTNCQEVILRNYEAVDRDYLLVNYDIPSVRLKTL
uniref:Uncharacterized protein n=1 Tax=Planktothrix agardhii TaxID=1160 RepID=A0A1J1JKM5_PLAAG|nr:protein of unknown function [Planktothrix agardhii]